MPVIAFGTGSKWKGKVRLCPGHDAEACTEYWSVIASQDVTDYVIQAIETGFSHIDSAQCMSSLARMFTHLFTLRMFG